MQNGILGKNEVKEDSKLENMTKLVRVLSKDKQRCMIQFYIKKKSEKSGQEREW